MNESVSAGGEVWTPLREPRFARIYLSFFLSFAATAIFDVSVAWSLAAAGAPASVVALVTSAATAAIVIFVLPFAALSDTVGRRPAISWALVWSAILSAVAALVLITTGSFTSGFALLFVFLAGAGVAVRLPAYSSLAPELVAREEVANAMTLLGMATSITRVAGPLLAASAFALTGGWLAFALAAAFCILALVALPPREVQRPVQPLPAERFLGSLRTAAAFVRESPIFRRTILKGGVFFGLASAVFALGPLHAQEKLGGGATTFMGVIAAMGTGALVGGLALPALRRRVDRALVPLAAALAGCGSLGVALAPSAWLIFAAAWAHGVGWLIAIATYTSAAQVALPDWFRARGMAATHIALIGGLAVGAAAWGFLADASGTAAAIALSGVTLAVAAVFGHWLSPRRLPDAPIDGERYWPDPSLQVAVADGDGPAVVTVDYEVPPDKVEAFLAAARVSRQMRLRAGAIGWSLFRDVENPSRFTEQILFVDWSDRARQAERTTRLDMDIRDQKVAAVAEGTSPVIRQQIGVRL